ncbi:MAG: tetraacyldisaccharide 4'-kinase [Bacteroidetes bacterium]|nr:tetraacyldisaccharide 4'-kinase [Bacteroidota bacterium]
MKHPRWLLFPFSLAYGLVVVIRNWLYDAGIFKSRQFSIPVISVGNLEVGGAGKSPMTEYLVRLFKDDHRVATLSRGYGRTTKGFLTAPIAIGATATATEIGDEPAQFKHKFPDVTVAVCESRVRGIDELKHTHEVIILDDAYQHRAVKPGFSVLLFDYGKIKEPHLLLPAGDLREPMSGRWRADVLIVSKCPNDISIEEQGKIAALLEPLPYQYLFFTTIAYQPLENIRRGNTNAVIDQDTTVFLLTGIANPTPLVNYIKNYTQNIIHHRYPDHHRFSLKNISKLAEEFNSSAAHKKLIITTEKDAERLLEHDLEQHAKALPILILPIATEFLDVGGAQFDHLVKEYVREHSANHVIH